MIVPYKSLLSYTLKEFSTDKSHGTYFVTVIVYDFLLDFNYEKIYGKRLLKTHNTGPIALSKRKYELFILSLGETLPGERKGSI